MTNGASVAAFEAAFAEYVGARYACALCNGTATLHTALVALGVQPGDRVAVPPLTMSATTLAVLQAGAVPVFCDVDPRTWVMTSPDEEEWIGEPAAFAVPVALYGLHMQWGALWAVEDAAQTLRPHGFSAFTSYSFQASKILALGEGGMLVTNDEELATRAREFSSLGYRMRADQPRIDPAVLKSPTFARHHWPLAFNYRMNDITAREGLRRMDELPLLLAVRREAAAMYAQQLTAAAIRGCDWLTPQHAPDEWGHSWWAYAVACDTPERARWLQSRMGELGAEVPYGAWRLTYTEPAWRNAWWLHEPANDWDADGSPRGLCPVAEDLQPRLLQLQTNNLPSAERNAAALRRAIAEVGG